MSRTFLSSALGAGLVVASLGLALAGDRPGVKDDLAPYFAIRTALSADTTDGVADAAKALSKSGDKAVASAAEKVGGAGDIAATRKAFGELSKALIADVEAAAGAGADVGTVYEFECPMAKPYGRWLQAEEKLANPYYGKSMLRCGKQVAVFGKAGADAGDGHHHHE